ncbi:hypothetical protein D621_11660 [beta proteobacterium AAP51]|nr:hypothetical protein D621_11660 [beta proteobacterium AAP51]
MALYVHQGCRGAITQAGQRHTADMRCVLHQSVNRCAQIFVQVFEVAGLTGAVTHATDVKAQAAVACAGQGAGQLHELTVRSGTILRPSHHHQHGQLAGLGRRLGTAQHPEKAITRAIEYQGLLFEHHTISASAKAGPV